jgi:hypothetical protein
MQGVDGLAGLLAHLVGDAEDADHALVDEHVQHG